MFLRKAFSKNAANLQENTNAEKQLYWNRISTRVLSKKVTAYFQNFSSYENLWVAASVI